MANVPYQPYSTVTPLVSGERIREDTPDSAFGVNVGRAIEQLGTTGQQVGQELYQRATALQELQNETAAREQAVKTTQQMAERYEKFKELGQRMGEPGQLQAFYKDIEAMRVSGRGNLPNAHAQRFFDAEAANLQNRVTMASAASAGDAFKSRASGNAEAQIDLATRQWVNPKDEKEVNQKIDSMRKGIDTIAGVHGLSQAEVDDLAFKKISNLRKGQIHAIATTDSQTALNMLDDPKMKKQMTQTDYDAAQDHAMKQNRVVGAEFLAKQVYRTDKNLGDMEDEIRKLAPQYAHGDEMFEAHALKALQTKDIITHQAENRQFQEAKQTVDEALNSGRFKSEQEMKANPSVAVAIESMRPADQLALAGRIKTYWENQDFVGNKTEYDRLWGLSGSDPQRFLNEDLWAAKVDNGQRGKLLTIRKSMLKGQPSMDPQVQKAAAFIKNAWPHSIPQDTRSDAYHIFLGSLQGAMEDLIAKKGAKLDAQDYEKLGKVLIQEIPKSGYFSNYHIFDERIPDAVTERYHKLGITNDDEIAYTYRRGRAMSEYERLFGGGTPKKQ